MKHSESLVLTGGLASRPGWVISMASHLLFALFRIRGISFGCEYCLYRFQDVSSSVLSLHGMFFSICSILELTVE
jgi:hypothetical protein